jgi:hypothetical protein
MSAAYCLAAPGHPLHGPYHGEEYDGSPGGAPRQPVPVTNLSRFCHLTVACRGLSCDYLAEAGCC